MEIVKKTEEYQIIKKRNGRLGVRTLGRKWITGDEKARILVAEGLIKASEPKTAEEASEDAGAGADAGADADAEAGTEADASAEAETEAESEADKDAD